MSVFATSCAESAARPGGKPAGALIGRHRQPYRHRLIGFLLCSVLLHAGLLLIHRTAALPPLVPHAGGTPAIAARIVTRKPQPARPIPAHAHNRLRHHARSRTEQSPHRLAKNARSAPTATATTRPVHHGKSPTIAGQTRTPSAAHAAKPTIANLAPGTADPAARTAAQATHHRATPPAPRGADVRAAVERAFRARFYYPYVARRNGWQGEIDLGLHISAEGRISRVHVVKSSGYAVLDHAALTSARSIQVLPELVDLLYGQAFDLVLPVRYRLFNG